MPRREGVTYTTCSGCGRPADVNERNVEFCQDCADEQFALDCYDTDKDIEFRLCGQNVYPIDVTKLIR